MPEESWKDNLRSYFESFRIIEKCKSETVANFNQFCEFIAEPAFESLTEELKLYAIKAKFQKSKGSFFSYQINFPKSSVDNFHYIVFLPKNSVELRLKLRIKGRKQKRAAYLEREEEFMKEILPVDIMKLSKEDLIQDVIEHYRDFHYKALTSAD